MKSANPKCSFQKFLRAKHISYQTSLDHTQVANTHLTFDPQQEIIYFRDPAFNQIQYSIPFSIPEKIFSKMEKFNRLVKVMISHRYAHYQKFY